MKRNLFLLYLSLATTSVIVGQPYPCPPPPLVNYTLSVSPSNTISAGTPVIFRVRDGVNGNLINDFCSSAEWFVNGSLVYACKLGDGSTTTSYGYSTNILLDNDIVTCNIYQSCGCVAPTIYAVDNPITMHVSGVLPIELRDFSGNTEGGINHLFWSTASEINNKGFQIERLNSTTKTWEALGFVSAQGKAANYEFADTHPLSINYYRLRQLDRDGKEYLSKIIHLPTILKNQLKAYPTVTTHILRVEFTSEKDKTTYQIINILGQQVQSGTLIETLDVSALALGTYIIKVGTAQVKFYKQ